MRKALLSFFGTGLAPAGGTFTSAVVCALVLLLPHPLTPVVLLAFGCALTLALAPRSAGDPRWITTDEVAGQSLVVVVVQRFDWTWLLAAFLLFRALDIAKPQPVRAAERLPNPFGVLADDIAAGAVAAALLLLLRWRMST